MAKDRKEQRFPKDKNDWPEGPLLRPFYLDRPEDVMAWLERERRSLVLVHNFPPGFSREDSICHEIVFVGRCDGRNSPHDFPLQIEAFVALPVYDYFAALADKYARYLKAIGNKRPDQPSTGLVFTHYPGALALEDHPLAHPSGPTRSTP